MVWSDWIKEGHFLSYVDTVEEGTPEKFVFVNARDFAHYEWEFGFPEVAVAERTVASLTVGGPYTVSELKPTRERQIFQIIYGVKPDVYFYQQLPEDMKRHGLPKRAWHSRALREIAHFTMQMSPFHRPSFITEFFLIKNVIDYVDFSVFNPLSITVTPHMNFYFAKLGVENVGKVTKTDAGVVQQPASDRWTETLDKLYRRLIIYKPITLMPVWAEAAE